MLQIIGDEGVRVLLRTQSLWKAPPAVVDSGLHASRRERLLEAVQWNLACSERLIGDN
jgi:hypothetical protein